MSVYFCENCGSFIVSLDREGNSYLQTKMQNEENYTRCRKAVENLLAGGRLTVTEKKKTKGPREDFELHGTREGFWLVSEAIDEKIGDMGELISSFLEDLQDARWGQDNYSYDNPINQYSSLDESECLCIIKGERTGDYVSTELRLSDEFIEMQASGDRIEIAYERTEDIHCPLCGAEKENIEETRFVRFNSRLDGKAKQVVSEEREKALKKNIDVQTTLQNVDLKEYLRIAVGLEGELLLLTDRLAELYALKRETGRKVLRERLLPSVIKKEQLKKEVFIARNMLDELSEKYALWSVDNIRPEDYGLIKPIEPIRKYPNFFNKKKVIAENARAREEYERELKEYESEWAQIKEEESEKIEKKNDEIRRKHREEENELNLRIAELEEQLSMTGAIVGADTDARDDSITQKADRFFLKEIKDTKEKIDEICTTLVQMNSLGIIHPKYWNIVTLASLFDYLDTGRCTTLEGPDGAYNIYENEVLMNKIITRLDKVVDSLETIKENQYTMYMIMDDMKHSVREISSKMSRAVESLYSIEKANEMIEYNSARTAYYSRINAELTNAMGYLVALK